MSAMDNDDVIAMLLEGANWLKETAAVGSEHELVSVPISPQQARTLASVMETAALEVGSRERLDAEMAQLRERIERLGGR